MVLGSERPQAPTESKVHRQGRREGEISDCMTLGRDSARERARGKGGRERG